MVRPAEVLDEDIVAAGELLNSAGTRITGWSLRQTIGRGNPARLMTVWTNHLATSVGGPSQPDEAVRPLPPQVEAMATEMQTRLSNLCSAAWLSMYREVDRAVAGRYQAERDELAAVRATYEEEMAGAHAAILAADDQADSLAAQITALQAQLAAAAEERIRFEERLRMREETARTEIQRLVQTIREVEVQEAAISEALAESRQENALQRAEAEAAKVEVSRAREDLTAARAETVAVRNQLEAAQLELRSGHAQILSLEKALGKQEAEIVSLRAGDRRTMDHLRMVVAALIAALDALLPHAPDVVTGILDPVHDAQLLHSTLKNLSVRERHYAALERLGLIGDPNPHGEEGRASAASENTGGECRTLRKGNPDRVGKIVELSGSSSSLVIAPVVRRRAKK